MERKLVRDISKLSQIILHRIWLQGCRPRKTSLVQKTQLQTRQKCYAVGMLQWMWGLGIWWRWKEAWRKKNMWRAANVELTPQDQSECYWLDFTKPWLECQWTSVGGNEDQGLKPKRMGWYYSGDVWDLLKTTTNNWRLLFHKKDTQLTISISGANHFDSGIVCFSGGCHVIRMPPGCLLGKVFWACPMWRRPWDRPSTG